MVMCLCDIPANQYPSNLKASDSNKLLLWLAINTTYNIRIDKQVREQADALYKSMGLTLSSAVNLFLTQSVIQGRLPISEVIAEPSYADALLRDAAEIDKKIANGTAKVYASPEKMFKTWENE